MSKKKPMSSTIARDLWGEITELAAMRGVSRSTLVERALFQFLREERKSNRPPSGTEDTEKTAEVAKAN